MNPNQARKLALEEFFREHGREPAGEEEQMTAQCPHCGAVESDFRAIRVPGGQYRVVCKHCARLQAA